MTIFGQIVDATEVETAALTTLESFSRDYLAEMERSRGLPSGTLPQVRSWIVAGDFRHWPQEQLPSVLVVSSGMEGEPKREGSSKYRALFGLGFAVVVSASDQAASDRLARYYTAAFRTLILQHASLGGFASGVEWVDEAYDLLPERDGRTFAAGQSVFRVEVEDVATARGGPRTPSPDPSVPPPDGPIATDVEVEVTRLPIDD